VFEKCFRLLLSYSTVNRKHVRDIRPKLENERLYYVRLEISHGGEDVDVVFWVVMSCGLNG
jgi:hypothetical protein